MVKVGFIVEGASEKIFIESTLFNQWANANKLEICRPILDAKGNGNLLPKNIEPLVKRLQKENVAHIIILTDLDDALDSSVVKNRITTQYTSLIFIAVKALEAWFLADSVALSGWLKHELSEWQPENTSAMPYDRLKNLASDVGARGPGSKVLFAKKITKQFQIDRAAAHPHCPSAKTFHDGLLNL